MNMLDGLSDLQGNALAKVLRRTIVSAIVVGAAAIVIALLLSVPWAALGLAIGLGMAVVNLRFLDAGVAKLHTEGETNNKVLRRAMGTKSVTRLGIITLICVGLMLLERRARHRRRRRARHLPAALRGQRRARRDLPGDPMSNSFVLASGNITIGEHHGVVHVAGLTIYMDVVWTTLIAAAIVLGLGLRMRAKVTSGVPGKLQLFWETLVEQVSDLAQSAIGPEGIPFVGLGVTIFFFILICNWLAFVPSGDPGFLAPPTGDVNLPLALALTVFFLVHYNSVKARGWGGYFKHYAQPYAALTPINIIEEITKPITLTFRLFGNIFSGVLMIAVIVTLIPPYASWIGLIIWKPFDELFIGAIQAFIFGLLTIMYLGMGMSRDAH